MVNTNEEYNSNDNNNTYKHILLGALSYNINKNQQIQFIYSHRK